MYQMVYGTRPLNLQTFDYAQEPQYSTYNTAEGPVAEVYYYVEEDSETGPRKVFKTRRAETPEEFYAKYCGMSFEELNKSYFDNKLSALYKKLSHFRGVMPIINSGEPYDASTAEEFAFDLCRQLHALTEYATAQRNRKVLIELDECLRPHKELRAVAKNAEWIGEDLWRKPTHEFLQKNTYAELNAFFLELISVASDLKA